MFTTRKLRDFKYCAVDNPRPVHVRSVEGQNCICNGTGDPPRIPNSPVRTIPAIMGVRLGGANKKKEKYFQNDNLGGAQTKKI
jgi:hypothetical protein